MCCFLRPGLILCSKRDVIEAELVLSNNIQVITWHSHVESQPAKEYYRIKILKLSQTGELFFIWEMMDYFNVWFTKSRVFILFILIAFAWRFNTTLQVKYSERLFSNIRAFISSKYMTTSWPFLREKRGSDLKFKS